MLETHTGDLVIRTIACIRVIQCKYSSYYFDQQQFFRLEWSVAPYLNNQFYRTGVGSLPSWGEIELRQRERAVFLNSMVFSDCRLFFGKF